jgi:hypothetical protein
MAATLSGLSACVTRILSLTGFPKELKTKDIQTAFAEYEGLSGGFKIKWRDDTSLLIVFQDATVGESLPRAVEHSEFLRLILCDHCTDQFVLLAKRAYLNTLTFPPSILTSGSGVPATIRPYDGPDAQAVIQTVNARGQHHSSASRSHHPRAASVSVFPNARSTSGSILNPNNNRNGHASALNSQHVVIPERQADREPSPTLPTLPSHPTLNALISSSLGDAVAGADLLGSDPAILSTSLQQPQPLQHETSAPPRIGDPGKRMLGAALGVRHPGLGPRLVGGSGNISPANGIEQVQRAMGGLVVAE